MAAHIQCVDNPGVQVGHVKQHIDDQMTEIIQSENQHALLNMRSGALQVAEGAHLANEMKEHLRLINLKWRKNRNGR
jgi:hypothetical protein